MAKARKKRASKKKREPGLAKVAVLALPDEHQRQHASNGYDVVDLKTGKPIPKGAKHMPSQVHVRKISVIDRASRSMRVDDKLALEHAIESTIMGVAALKCASLDEGPSGSDASSKLPMTPKRQMQIEEARVVTQALQGEPKKWDTFCLLVSEAAGKTSITPSDIADIVAFGGNENAEYKRSASDTAIVLLAETVNKHLRLLNTSRHIDKIIDESLKKRLTGVS